MEACFREVIMSKQINIHIDDECELLLVDTSIKAKLSQSKIVRRAIVYYCENYEKIKRGEL